MALELPPKHQFSDGHLPDHQAYGECEGFALHKSAFEKLSSELGVCSAVLSADEDRFQVDDSPNQQTLP